MHTFKNLEILKITESVRNKDNEIIVGAKKESYIFFNTDIISRRELLESDRKKILELESKGIIVILNTIQANNLFDQ